MQPASGSRIGLWEPLLLSLIMTAIAGPSVGADSGIKYSTAGSAGVSQVHDMTLPLRELPLMPPRPTPKIRERADRDEIPFRPRIGRVSDVDAALQSTAGPASMPSPVVNFEGMGNINGVLPPDPMIAVGPHHIVEAINVSLQIFDKSGVSLLGPASLFTLWQGFGGPCETTNDGDPVVLHDQLADRWVISQFSASSPFGECIAVSVSSDPTGAWYRYFFNLSTTTFYDYPKLGVWPDAYYLTAARLNGTAFVGGSAIALDRSAMLLGLTAAYQERTIADDAGFLPADLDGSTLPPGGAPEYLVNLFSTDQLHLLRMHVDWTTPANTVLTGPTALPIVPYTELCPSTKSCVDQPATTVNLDALGDRLMNRLAYRNLGDHAALVVNHAARVGSQAAVRWYEIRDTAGAVAVYQQGTYAPDTTSRWMGSAAMDGAGDMAIGYSVSSSTVFPGLRYSGRLASDPAGQLSQGETTLIAGAGAQTHSASRWGDYSALVIDPVDDCTFWYASEYVPSTSTAGWHTRIGSFGFPGCVAAIPSPVPDGRFVSGSPMLVAKNGTNVDLTWTTAGCSSSAYNLYWGSIGNFAALTGAACGLAPTGSASGVPIPNGSFFVLTGSAGGRVAQFGYTSSGAEEAFAGWPALCSQNGQVTAICN